MPHRQHNLALKFLLQTYLGLKCLKVISWDEGGMFLITCWTKCLDCFKAESGPTGWKSFLRSEWKAVHEINVKPDVKLLKDVCRGLSKLEN